MRCGRWGSTIWNFRFPPRASGPRSAALDEDHRRARPEYEAAEVPPAAARLRRALPCVRPGGEVSLRARRLVLAAGFAIRGAAAPSQDPRLRKGGDRPRQLPWL